MKKADKSRREMAQETKQTQAPVLCATGCGFYGNPRTSGMCSVCYKDSLQRQNSTARVSPSASSGGGSVALEGSTVAVPSALSLAATTTEQSSQSTEQVDLQRDETGLQTEPQGSALDDSDHASVDGQDRSPDKLKQKKNRCFTCRKKVGLTGFDCRCGNVFCGTHRYSDVHSCSFDYKAEAAEKIRKENPVVVGEKIHKI
ncbi:hypothetical protein SKAU_G00312880 [Synaphobranchus kaupii]|uniref:AN1-type zinc finger protein 6 n=1 Tax=Synaphobranchus kaupii TaxID=118154 RepID=A0A9Q1IJB7_SYNKA|nr:hypothetical protein SKAU_G00312880 [Synaphobranchus kaupii]